uniref:Uncharacterized protein n=1 Tax=Parascaris univalens TaxID=6257 RepID=A0A915B3L7_PARUN
MKQDREITEEWALVTEEREPIFDAPPFVDISEERLQWVLGMIDKNSQGWERSTEEQGKSTADAIRDDAEEIIEAASNAFQKSSTALAKELEDIAFRWRWIVGGAIAAVLAVGCAAAAIFLYPEYLLCAARRCCVRYRRQERSPNLASPQGTEPPMEIRSFEPIWMPPTNVKGRGSVAKREMRHRGSLQSTCSKKGLTVSAAPITIRNDKKPNANDDTPSGIRGIKTKRFNGEKGMLHTVPKMVNGKKGMLHSSPKMVNGIKSTLHALAEMEGGARQIGESSRSRLVSRTAVRTRDRPLVWSSGELPFERPISDPPPRVVIFYSCIKLLSTSHSLCTIFTCRELGRIGTSNC